VAAGQMLGVLVVRNLHGDGREEAEGGAATGPGYGPALRGASCSAPSAWLSFLGSGAAHPSR
jgi:hypothetical protein